MQENDISLPLTGLDSIVRTHLTSAAVASSHHITLLIMKSYALFSALFFLSPSEADQTETNGDTLHFDSDHTAVVLIDPQNDFLSPDGATWMVVGDSVTENDTVDNIDKLFRAARENNLLVFISPHYYFPHDHDWEFGGTLERLMHDIKMFDRPGPLSLEGFEGSGADWLEQYKTYINGNNVIVCSPHKVYGPEQNDLALQLRKRKIDKIILAGMSANLCVESHLRHLLEQGFEVYTVTDATAGAKTEELGDGYAAAMTNFRFISNGVLDTAETVDAMGGLTEDRDLTSSVTVPQSPWTF
jgi:nicotinamidase-related amidase